MNTDVTAYAGLFLAALIAATILPAQSETVLAALILSGGYSTALLVLVASVGNILGSVINWGLGRWIEHFKNRKWFPVSEMRMAQAEGWYRRYGRWSLLASWIPIIGDPITVVAGVLRVPFTSFLILVSLAKTGRYLAIAWAIAG